MKEPSPKQRRQQEILSLIEQIPVETQEDLAALLNERGFAVTQATVSRDIRELRISKAPSISGHTRYTTEMRPDTRQIDRLRRIFSDTVVDMDYAENLVVLKTLAGSAHAAAETVDTLQWPEVLATLAGDNTVLVIVRSADLSEEVLRRFRGMLSC